MSDLSTQLREYFDATAPPSDLDAITTDEVWVPARHPIRRRAGMIPPWAYGLGALVLVLVVTLGLSLLGGNGNEVVEPTPTTILSPDVETMTARETIQAGVDALYSGDADRAVELFEVPDLDDQSIRRWAAFQAAVDGRLTLDCTEQDTPGVFSCVMPYHNAFTDAIGWVDSPGDIGMVVVADGVITEFPMPVHTFIHRGVEKFLIEEGARFLSEAELDLVSGCVFCSYDAEVASLAMDHLDEWAAWNEADPELPETAVGNATPLTQEEYEPIEPGAYFVDADGDPSTTAGATFLIETKGWIGSKGGVNFNGLNGVSPHTLHLKLFVEPFTPVCGLSGVTAGVPLAAGSTPADLVDGFAASGFTVLEAPAPVSAFGHDGYHVVVEVPEGCQFGGEGTPHIWVYPGDVIEVWSFDMDGSIAMVEALWLTEPTLEEDLAVLRAVIDTLVLTP